MCYRAAVDRVDRDRGHSRDSRELADVHEHVSAASEVTADDVELHAPLSSSASWSSSLAWVESCYTTGVAEIVYRVVF